MIDEYIVDYEEYVGIGSGAFSYLDGALYVNTFSLREYGERLGAGRMGVAGSARSASTSGCATASSCSSSVSSSTSGASSATSACRSSAACAWR